MKRSTTGIAASVLAICVAGPAIGHPTSMHSSATSTSPMMTSHSTAAPTPASTPRALGQPNQTCGSASAPNTPGNAASARGSAFNPDGIAGTKYAGQQPQNSNNPAAVAQYDVACSHQP